MAALRHQVVEIESLQARLTHSKTQVMALMHDVETRPDYLQSVADAKRVLSRVLSNIE